MLQAVATITGSIFFGLQLCRRSEYHYAAVNYTVDVALAGAELKNHFAFLKLLVAKLAEVRKHRRDLTASLKSIVKERKHRLKQGLDLPEDALIWIIRLARAKCLADLDHIVNLQLMLLTVSIRIAACFVTRLEPPTFSSGQELRMTQIEPIYYSSLHGLYDLATQPETAGELRAEIWPIVSDNNGFMTHKALYDMKLTDNFMKQC